MYIHICLYSIPHTYAYTFYIYLMKKTEKCEPSVLVNDKHTNMPQSFLILIWYG